MSLYTSIRVPVYGPHIYIYRDQEADLIKLTASLQACEQTACGQPVHLAINELYSRPVLIQLSEMYSNGRGLAPMMALLTEKNKCYV